MNYATDILRLNRRIEWAEAYTKRAIQSRSFHRAKRGADLQMLLETRMRGHIGREISPYKDRE
jgi:hypothetical protein